MTRLLRYWNENKSWIPWTREDLHASVCRSSDGDLVSLSHEPLLPSRKLSFPPLSLFLCSFFSLPPFCFRFAKSNEKLMKLDVNFFSARLHWRSLRNWRGRLVSVDACWWIAGWTNRWMHKVSALLFTMCGGKKEPEHLKCMITSV